MNARRKPTAAQLESIHLLRQMTGRKHILLSGRGAAGIQAVLQALGFRDRPVLIPANTCYIVLWAVLRSGNHPCLVDVDPHTGMITPETLAACDVSNPAALIPCHLYGLPAPMTAICAWARERNIFVLEDAALAIGAAVEGRPAGSWGDASIFSFGLGKVVDAEIGGALLSDDGRLMAEVGEVFSHFPRWTSRQGEWTEQWNALYWALHQYEDRNPRLLDLYPALFHMYGELIACRLPPSYWDDLPASLRAVPADRERRLKTATLYDDLLAGTLLRTLPRADGSTLWRYPLLVPPEQRDNLLHHLWDNSIHDATRWYPSLRPMRAALAPDLPPQSTPGADAFCAQIINLPVKVDEETARRVGEVIRDYGADSRA